jgi:hypothetical protein
MAILIPSKNIYEYVESNKISKSAIKKIVIEAKKPQIVRQKEVVVFDEKVEIPVEATQDKLENFSMTGILNAIKEAQSEDIEANTLLLNCAIAKTEVSLNKYSINRSFERFLGKKLITNVYQKNSGKSSPQVNYSGYEISGVLGNDYKIKAQKDKYSDITASELKELLLKYKSPAIMKSEIDNVISDGVLDALRGYIRESDYQQTENKQIEDYDLSGFLGDNSIDNNFASYTTTATATFPNVKIGIELNYNKIEKTYSLSFYPINYIRRTNAKASFLSGDSLNELEHFFWIIAEVGFNPIYSNYISHHLSEANIKIYGDINSLELEDKNILVGETDSEAFAISGSELTQDTNYFEYNGSKTENILSIRYNNTLKQYNNGKEIYVIMCDFNEYYDEQGALVKSTKSDGNMSFDIDDVVIPFVRGADGKDRYLSFKKDGQPRSLYVKGTEIIYDGACWQKLYLQEV